MTFYTMTVNLCGIAENVSIIRTPTAQVVLYHLPSASNLALGYDMKTSVQNAKNYITGALKDGLDLGEGSGPLNHCFNL